MAGLCRVAMNLRQPSPAKKLKSVFAEWQEDGDEPTGNEIDLYITRKHVDDDEPPCWWKKNSNVYPRLAEVARRIFLFLRQMQEVNGISWQTSVYLICRLPYKIKHVGEMILYCACVSYEHITTDLTSFEAATFNQVQARDLTSMQHSGGYRRVRTALCMSNILFYCASQIYGINEDEGVSAHQLHVTPHPLTQWGLLPPTLSSYRQGDQAAQDPFQRTFYVVEAPLEVLLRNESWQRYCAGYLIPVRALSSSPSGLRILEPGIATSTTVASALVTPPKTSTILSTFSLAQPSVGATSSQTPTLQLQAQAQAEPQSQSQAQPSGQLSGIQATTAQDMNIEGFPGLEVPAHVTIHKCRQIATITNKKRRKGELALMKQMLDDIRVAEEIRGNYPNVDKLIATIKKIFMKAPLRVQKFKEIVSPVPLLPQPILTRWVTWLNYYCTNYNVIENVVNEFNEVVAPWLSILGFRDQQLVIDLLRRLLTAGDTGDHQVTGMLKRKSHAGTTRKNNAETGQEEVDTSDDDFVEETEEPFKEKVEVRDRVVVSYKVGSDQTVKLTVSTATALKAVTPLRGSKLEEVQKPETGPEDTEQPQTVTSVKTSQEVTVSRVQRSAQVPKVSGDLIQRKSEPGSQLTAIQSANTKPLPKGVKIFKVLSVNPGTDCKIFPLSEEIQLLIHRFVKLDFTEAKPCKILIGLIFKEDNKDNDKDHDKDINDLYKNHEKDKDMNDKDHNKDHDKKHDKDYDTDHGKDHDMKHDKLQNKNHNKDLNMDHNKDHGHCSDKDHDKDHSKDNKDHDKKHDKDNKEHYKIYGNYHDKDHDMDHDKDHKYQDTETEKDHDSRHDT
ncbi:hypothetical protein ANN_10830 [Periplaneta americana]|uniref:HAT C-terminal dimerisation domain-containing protein n=1 Tax=Periplaneta americana TaxID=6978 RepID=A0ABQ8T3C2_PERAM|nr:hypothetical protein ANN_10830 [Periplaneta americana]